MGEVFRGCIVKISSNLTNTSQRERCRFGCHVNSCQDGSLVLHKDHGLKMQALLNTLATFRLDMISLTISKNRIYLFA